VEKMEIGAPSRVASSLFMTSEQALEQALKRETSQRKEERNLMTVRKTEKRRPGAAASAMKKAPRATGWEEREITSTTGLSSLSRTRNVSTGEGEGQRISAGTRFGVLAYGYFIVGDDG
jgi:hypothetical protein